MARTASAQPFSFFLDLIHIKQRTLDRLDFLILFSFLPSTQCVGTVRKEEWKKEEWLKDIDLSKLKNIYICISVWKYRQKEFIGTCKQLTADQSPDITFS